MILVAQTGNASLRRSPLSLVSAQALLISHGASSAKLSFLLESRGSRRDCQPCAYNESEEWLGAAFKQMPPPHFCFKVKCKKGGVFSGAYGTHILMDVDVISMMSSCFT